MAEDEKEPWKQRGYSDAEIDAIRLIAKQKRKELTKQLGMNHASTNKSGAKRYIDGQVRDALKEFKGPNSRRPSIKLLTSKMRNSTLLDSLVANRSETWKEISSRRWRRPETIALENFSFVTNPVATMQTLHRIATAECLAYDGTLNFMDQVCLDLGPYVVLQSMWQDMAPVFRGGAITIGMQNVIESVGLREQMEMRPFKKKGSIQTNPFKIRMRRPSGSSKSATRHLDVQKREYVADDLIDWFNNWLGVLVSQRLNLEGGRTVKKIVGEVLDNAERHSDIVGRDGDWAIAGCVRQIENEGSQGYWCHLSFLSVGSTICESMKTCDPQTRQAIEKYSDLHKAVSSLDEEALTTVFALQDGVTRISQAFEERRGGTGLLDILHFFSGIAGTMTDKSDPRLAIVSGSTCVLAMGGYINGTKRSGDVELLSRQLWFNSENSARVCPSSDHVIKLPHKLQGTLVTMSFPLDVDYLERTVGMKNEQH
jgi:hypothetical protein